MREISRRELLQNAAAAGAAAAAELIPGAQSEAKEETFDFLGSSLTPENLAMQKERAILSLKESIPGLDKLDYLREHAEHLEHESQMYLPSSDEIRRITSQRDALSDLNSLARTLEPGQTGLYIFADVIEVEGKQQHFQRLYVVRRDAANVVRFEKGYAVSLAERGFGDDKDSYKTPLGLHQVLSGQIGRYGEVVVAVKRNMESFFNRITLGKQIHWFVRGFGERLESREAEAALDRAEVVTDRYTIDEQRGIHIHGTNRSGRWDKLLQKWTTYLGGRRRSGGCIRMSNTDVRDLGLSGYVSLPTSRVEKRRNIKVPGTRVMIHATPAARNAAALTSSEFGTDYPQRRRLPEDEGGQVPEKPPALRPEKATSPKKFNAPSSQTPRR